MALPEIANPTIAQLHSIVNENIANDVVGGIDPADDRAVRNSIINFLANLTAPALKYKVVTLATFLKDNFYTVPTTIIDGATIISATCMLVCKVANNGWVIGDIITPSDPDASTSGMAVKFNSTITSVDVLISNNLQTLKKNGTFSDNIEVVPAQWSVKITILYV
jgi:hypothetical protein